MMHAQVMGYGADFPIQTIRKVAQIFQDAQNKQNIFGNAFVLEKTSLGMSLLKNSTWNST